MEQELLIKKLKELGEFDLENFIDIVRLPRAAARTKLGQMRKSGILFIVKPAKRSGSCWGGKWDGAIYKVYEAS
jgi:hypothetical protein